MTAATPGAGPSAEGLTQPTLTPDKKGVRPSPTGKAHKPRFFHGIKRSSPTETRKGKMGRASQADTSPQGVYDPREHKGPFVPSYVGTDTPTRPGASGQDFVADRVANTPDRPVVHIGQIASGLPIDTDAPTIATLRPKSDPNAPLWPRGNSDDAPTIPGQENRSKRPDIYGHDADVQHAIAMQRMDADRAPRNAEEAAHLEQIAEENRILQEDRRQRKEERTRKKQAREQSQRGGDTDNPNSTGLAGFTPRTDRTPPPPARDPHNGQGENNTRSANGSGRPERPPGRPGPDPERSGLVGTEHMGRADVVKGYIAHTREVQRLRQQERSFFGKMIHGLTDPLTVYYGAYKLKNFVDAYRSENGQEPIFTDALVKSVLDSRGLFRVPRNSQRFSELSAQAQLTGKAHEAMQTLAGIDANRVGTETVGNEVRLKARAAIDAIVEGGLTGEWSEDKITAFAAQYGIEKNQAKELIAGVRGIYTWGEAQRIKFVTPDAFKNSVTDQLLYAGLSPEQQDQARKVAAWTAVAAGAQIARFALIPATGGLGLGGSMIASGVIGGVARAPSLLGQGSVFRFNELRGSQVVSRDANPGGPIERILSRSGLARWLTIDWNKDKRSYAWQFARASISNALLAGFMNGAEHGFGGLPSAIEGFAGNVGHNAHEFFGGASAAHAVGHATEAAVQAHTETVTQTLSFADFLHQHGISNVDFQHHVTVSPDAQHGATWAYDVSNHWTPHSMTWNVYAHGDQINYFTLHLPNNQVAIVDLAHSSIHPGPNGEYSFTFDAHNTTDHFTLIDIKGHPVGTISSEQAFQLWHTTGQLPHSGVSSDFRYVTQGYVRGLTEFGHFDAAKDVFVRYGEVQGHGGFGDLHNVALTTHQAATVHGAVDVDGKEALSDGIVTPQGIAVHNGLEQVADWGGEATDWVMQHPVEDGLILLSTAAGFAMRRWQDSHPGSRAHILAVGTGGGLTAAAALAIPYFTLGNPLGVAAGYLLGGIGGKKKAAATGDQHGSTNQNNQQSGTSRQNSGAPWWNPAAGDETEVATAEKPFFTWPEGTAAPTGGGSANGGSGRGTGDGVNATISGSAGTPGGMAPAPVAPGDSTAAAAATTMDPAQPLAPIAPAASVPDADPTNAAEVAASAEAVKQALNAVLPSASAQPGQPNQPAQPRNPEEIVRAVRQALNTPLTSEDRQKLENGLRATPYGRALMALQSAAPGADRDKVAIKAALEGLKRGLTPQELASLTYVLEPNAPAADRKGIASRLEARAKTQMKEDARKDVPIIEETKTLSFDEGYSARIQIRSDGQIKIDYHHELPNGQGGSTSSNGWQDREAAVRLLESDSGLERVIQRNEQAIQRDNKIIEYLQDSLPNLAADASHALDLGGGHIVEIKKNNDGTVSMTYKYNTQDGKQASYTQSYLNAADAINRTEALVIGSKKEIADSRRRAVQDEQILKYLQGADIAGGNPGPGVSGQPLPRTLIPGDGTLTANGNPQDRITIAEHAASPALPGRGQQPAQSATGDNVSAATPLSPFTGRTTALSGSSQTSAAAASSTPGTAPAAPQALQPGVTSSERVAVTAASTVADGDPTVGPATDALVPPRQVTPGKVVASLSRDYKPSETPREAANAAAPAVPTIPTPSFAQAVAINNGGGWEKAASRPATPGASQKLGAQAQQAFDTFQSSPAASEPAQTVSQAPAAREPKRVPVLEPDQPVTEAQTPVVEEPVEPDDQSAQASDPLTATVSTTGDAEPSDEDNGSARDASGEMPAILANDSGPLIPPMAQQHTAVSTAGGIGLGKYTEPASASMASPRPVAQRATEMPTDSLAQGFAFPIVRGDGREEASVSPAAPSQPVTPAAEPAQPEAPVTAQPTTIFRTSPFSPVAPAVEPVNAAAEEPTTAAEATVNSASEPEPERVVAEPVEGAPAPISESAAAPEASEVEREESATKMIEENDSSPEDTQVDGPQEMAEEQREAAWNNLGLQEQDNALHHLNDVISEDLREEMGGEGPGLKTMLDERHFSTLLERYREDPRFADIPFTQIERILQERADAYLTSTRKWEELVGS